VRLFCFTLTPLQAFILSFAAVIVTATPLLMLPWAVRGEPLSFIDALFTATSAMCVTGLVVVDTGSTFTFFGQAVILLLIQVGGIGIMTFSTFILLIIGKRIGIAGSYMVQDSFSDSGTLRISRLIAVIMAFTAAMEILGAVFLFACFRNDPKVASPGWSSVFHAVSAFCNAGFSLYRDSFCRYRDVVSVNIVLCMLIITGGIGFPVVYEILRFIRALARGMHARVNIHTKIVLLVTLFLLAAGTAAIYVSEPQCRESGAPLLSSFFQSVTARTAGFNTIDFSRASDAMLLVTNALMFIGGSSGSTAGGIKTTTFLVILILVWSHILGKPHSEFAKRTISPTNSVKALSLLVVFIIIVFLATFSILLLHEECRIPRKFSAALFEVISAIGTVGLSAGFTPHLTSAGKAVIIAVMFLGRLGPLAIARVIIKPRRRRPFRFPEENLMIG